MRYADTIPIMMRRYHSFVSQFIFPSPLLDETMFQRSFTTCVIFSLFISRQLSFLLCFIFLIEVLTSLSDDDDAYMLYAIVYCLLPIVCYLLLFYILSGITFLVPERGIYIAMMRITNVMILKY